MARKIRRILVRGCPRSGNTMLYAMLCSCFKNIRQIPGERIPGDSSLAKLAKVRSGELVAVAKYPRPITPGILGDKFEEGRRFIEDPPADALLIFIVRDPRDALMSKHGSFGDEPFLKSAAGWVSVMDEIERIRGRDNVMVIKFEDLVLDADRIQQEIATRAGLEIAGSFSSFNEMIGQSDISLTEHNLGELNGLRPLDTTRVLAYRSQPPEAVRPIIDKILEQPNADRFIRSFGYEPLQ